VLWCWLRVGDLMIATSFLNLPPEAGKEILGCPACCIMIIVPTKKPTKAGYFDSASPIKIVGPSPAINIDPTPSITEGTRGL